MFFHELYHKKGNIFLKKNKLEEALKNFEKALEIKFDHVPSLRSKVVVLKKINKLIDALKELDKILLYDDDKVKAYMQRAAIYISLRNPLEAMRNFEKAYSSQPNIPFVI